MLKSWHTKSAVEIFEILKTREHGLSESEVQRRLIETGRNKLPEAKVDSIFVIFLRQFQDPLIYILFIAGVVVFLIGETVDAMVIVFVLIFNAIIGAFQEGKARNTLLALKQFVETKAVVIREEREDIIKDEEVVQGDILVLQEGEKVPADARIISAHNFKVDEAALTGESVPVHKHIHVLANPDLPSSEKRNMVFKGTNIVSGKALAIVVGTGLDTVIGKIAKEVSEIDTDIPLKKNIKNLSRIFIISTIVLCVTLFILGLLYGYPLREIFATTVSVAVSAIPSGLPIALTIILASGVWRMSKRNALVKRLQAVEALGQAKIIAVDKTGTITKNEMMVQKVIIGEKIFEIGGVGYEPHGEVRLDGVVVDPASQRELMLATKLTALSSSARAMYSEERKEWRVSGDPTEAAMYVLAEKVGLNKDDMEKHSPLLSEIPFEYSLKYHATLHEEKGKDNFMSIVGAPEMILSLSEKILNNGRTKKMSKKEREGLEKTISEISKQGLRVIALAQKKVLQRTIDKENVRDLVFVGLLGLKDALRLEVRAATASAQEAGLKVVMITGDHKETATAIAREAGIFRDGDIVLSGADIEKMNDLELKHHLEKVSVFARVTPEHKLRIINAYKARGEVIAMTGDGVNDAPSLVAADLGLGMGKVGTEVAKEASDIILLDDNFGSIVAAIEEGRGIYKSIKKVIVYLVSTSIGEALVIVIALLIGLPLPLLAAQIIWLNFVTDGFFIPALAMEPREDNLLKAKFETPNKYMVDKFMAQRMFVMATPMVIFSLLLFALNYEADLAKAMTMSLTILCVFQWLNAWNSRSETESIFKMNPFTNMWLIGGTFAAFIIQLFAVYHPFFQTFLRTVPLDLVDWLTIFALSLSIIVAEEFRKALARKKVLSGETRHAVAG